MSLRKILLASLSGLLAGCTLFGADPIPTPYPTTYLPTVIALTGEAALATSFALTPAPSPTSTPEPTQTSIPPTPLPSETPTPEPAVPLAQIQFLAPGPLSKIASPLNLQAKVVAGESEVVQVSLLGEDGRLLARTIQRLPRRPSGVYLPLKIPFEIRAAAEAGWIQISTLDKHGHIQALNSLNLILLSVGESVINPAGNVIYERLVLYTPEENASISGGQLQVTGRFWPFNDQPFFLELILPDGQVAGTRVLTLKGLETQEFSATIPYKVSESTLALLTVRQMDARLNLPLYIYTRAVTLNP
ncbi:MAG: hypothetical protein ACP5QU_00645 [Anaerolineae bacterium]